MMIDFIKAIKHLSDKDKPFLGHCTLEARYSSGWEKYSLEGCKNIEVWWHPCHRIIKIQGSIMYYWQGHNFSYSRKEFVLAINHVNRLLQISLWNAIVEVFEFGIIIQVEHKPKEYINKHRSAPKEKLLMNEKPQDKGNFRWWNDSNVSLKMYDAGRNILCKQGLRKQDIIQEAGWIPSQDFLKWECHYLKPVMLNHGRGIQLANLVNPDWECVFKEDLYLQYKRLIPMKTIEIPTNKKDLRTADILAIEEIQVALNLGESIDDVRRRKYAFINQLPIPKADKDARKRQVKEIFDKITECPESKWDLSDKILESLEKG